MFEITHSSSYASLLPSIALLGAMLTSFNQTSQRPTVDLPPTDNAQASVAFARYTTTPEAPGAWNVEAVEIEASLPQTARRGKLRAIRRVLLGKPEYQVLEIDGDPTVKRQVIGRYLSAEVEAAALPAASIAITPANYKFRFKGSAQLGGSEAFIFQITPRKKRAGMIQGELWLDAHTGAVVRQSGYLVKKPSIFVKRIEITKDTSLHNGLAEERVTHLTIETRIVGRAELTIHERPYVANADDLEEK